MAAQHAHAKVLAAPAIDLADLQRTFDSLISAVKARQGMREVWSRGKRKWMKVGVRQGFLRAEEDRETQRLLLAGGVGVMEELHVEVWDGWEIRDRLLQVPCCLPEGGEAPSQEDTAQLHFLLQAHAEMVAGQKEVLNAAGLVRTFEPLLHMAKRTKGWRTRTVDLSKDALGMQPMPSYGVTCQVTKLPIDLLRIKQDLEVRKSEE